MEFQSLLQKKPKSISYTTQQIRTHLQKKPKRIEWGLLEVATMLNTLEYILIWWNSADLARNDSVWVVRHFDENIQNSVQE